MSTVKFKVESGIQLLARLRRRPDIENFYPVLFENGPKPGEVIELYSEFNMSCILIDMITEAIIPTNLGGVDAGVLVFNTDGNLNFELLAKTLKRKLHSRVTNSSNEQMEYTDEELNRLLHTSLSNLYMLEVYDATQFYTTLHNLERVLVENSNITMIVFHTLTAFYWSEQGFKITKMEVYLKTLLRLIFKITKEYKTITLYTRPEYFSSSKDPIEKLEGCTEQTIAECVNYHVQMLSSGDGSYQAVVKTFSKLIKRKFYLNQMEVKWQ